MASTQVLTNRLKRYSAFPNVQEVMELSSHWQSVYESHSTQQQSWFEEHLTCSLEFIEAADPDRKATILDAGGGDSTLVDDLLARGYEHLTVLDISGAALGHAQARLGRNAGRVRWIEGDMFHSALPRAEYDLWHDRAVFHFLTEPEQRRRYVDQLRLACKPSAFLVIGTFGRAGPTKCSGLPTMHYSAAELSQELGSAFHMLRREEHVHKTPSGSEQQFLYCLFQLSS